MSSVEQLLLDNDLDGTPFFVNEDFKDAILGYTDEEQLVYSYEKMVEYLVEKDHMSYGDASEWINYNVIRTIPYMGDKHPIIVYDLY